MSERVTPSARAMRSISATPAQDSHTETMRRPDRVWVFPLVGTSYKASRARCYLEGLSCSGRFEVGR